MTSKKSSEKRTHLWIGKTVADWPVNAPSNLWGGEKRQY